MIGSHYCKQYFMEIMKKFKDATHASYIQGMAFERDIKKSLV